MGLEGVEVVAALQSSHSDSNSNSYSDSNNNSDCDSDSAVVAMSAVKNSLNGSNGYVTLH